MFKIMLAKVLLNVSYTKNNHCLAVRKRMNVNQTETPGLILAEQKMDCE
jgi:hypothetical protein